MTVAVVRRRGSVDEDFDAGDPGQAQEQRQPGDGGPGLRPTVAGYGLGQRMRISVPVPINGPISPTGA